MATNTLDGMMQAKIRYQVGRVQWLMNEDGLTLEEAVAEARKSSTFTDRIWDEIKVKVKSHH